ncbi:putative disease resistance protein RGA3 [Chenopodium quinoa]|uniref:putative disease resistance protein RGA3 n=1 Tax=Chenopodium quinoa TaxID=63459 RepID=UPI000B798B4D|nr:putative disease resistance protein RGA3 [Chenopodium quinoa]
MTALKDLDVFIVGKNNGIDSLPPLNITGYVDIEFSKWRSDAVVEAQRANLKDNQHLVRLKLMFGSMEVTPADFGEMDRMLLSLQLPPNLKNISVQQYKGVEMPRRWLDGLSKLVFIRIEYCSNCRVLPHMSQQPHLKELYLSSFDSLEYVEDEDDVSVGDGKCDSGAHNNVYYPSLENLQLLGLTSLKGWTRPSKGDDVGETRHWLFPRLLKMNVDHFSKLMSMPLAPKLESLRAQVINWKVFESNLTSVDDEEASSSSTNLFTSLKELDISTIEDGPTSLTISNRFSNLQSIHIGHCGELTSLMIESSNPIRYLHINGCKHLKNISVGNISVLDTLIIEGGGNDLEEELSQSIACLTTLQKLEISRFNTVKQLPEEMSNLSLLRELKIVDCPKMVSLPLSLFGLTSLQKLCISSCPDLKERYEMPNGQDCHLLQHIPNVIFF